MQILNGQIECFSSINEETLVKMLGFSSLDVIMQFECIFKWISKVEETTSITDNLYNYVFFMFTYLTSDDETEIISSNKEYASQNLFSKTFTDSTTFINLPIHKQMLDSSGRTTVQHGFEAPILFNIRTECSPSTNRGAINIALPCYNDSCEPLELNGNYIHDGSHIDSEYTIFDLITDSVWHTFNISEIVACTTINNYLFIAMKNGKCCILNPRNITFSEVSSLPSNCTCLDLIKHGVDIFAVIVEIVENSRPVYCMKKYDFQKNIWGDFLQLPTSLYYYINSKVCEANQMIYIYGYEEDSEADDLMISVDPENSQFTILPCVPQTAANIYKLFDCVFEGRNEYFYCPCRTKDNCIYSIGKMWYLTLS